MYVCMYYVCLCTNCHTKTHTYAYDIHQIKGDSSSGYRLMVINIQRCTHICTHSAPRLSEVLRVGIIQLLPGLW